MLACRHYFERANLEAAEIIRSGKIGEPRLFSSVFCTRARPRRVPVQAGLSASPLYDIGLGCIDAARHVFHSEPIEVLAMILRGHDGRFREAEEGTSVILRFPEDRLMSLSCGFGGYDVSSYRIIGSRGELRVKLGYEFEDFETSDRAPTGDESADDALLLEAIFESAASGQPVEFEPASRRQRSTSVPARPPARRLRAAPLGASMLGPAR